MLAGNLAEILAHRTLAQENSDNKETILIEHNCDSASTKKANRKY